MSTEADMTALRHEVGRWVVLKLWVRMRWVKRWLLKTRARKMHRMKMRKARWWNEMMEGIGRHRHWA